jgi:hypothetical protein
MRLTTLALALFVAGLAASGVLATQTPARGKSTTIAAGARKVLLCHATHVKTHPYVLIRVSVKSAHALLRHGDVLPTNGKCPAATSVGTTASTTTDTTPRTTTSG